jgi:hypothetical protein
MDKKSILNKCSFYIKYENLSKLDYIFEYDSVGIAKQFIKDTMGLDCENMSFEDIRNNVVRIFSHMKIQFPNEEIDFYNTIFKRLMFLEGLPKVEYKILNEKVKALYEKINRIKDHIEAKQTQIEEDVAKNKEKFKDLNRKINKLKNKCKPYKEELKKKEMIVVEVLPKLDYEARKCRHYKQLLEDELKEIQSIDLRLKALSICSVSSWENNSYKYHISYLEDSEELFQPDCDYSISVKFAKELYEFVKQFDNKFNFDKEKYKQAYSEYPYHSNVIEALRNKSIDEYNIFLANYIKEKNVCEYIINSVEKNHVLSKRLEILESALNEYKNQQYLSFINIAAIQIEGMFYDYCFELDIQPKNLDSFSINSKLKELYDKQMFNAYEYFAFGFPLIRNKVAHGLMTDKTDKIEIEKIAHETLLDLQYLVHVFQTNKKFPYYKPLEFVKTYMNANNNSYAFHAKINKTDPKDECLYSHLRSYKYNLTPHDPINNLQWILNPMYNEVYEFYKIEKEHEEIKNRLLSCNFIQFISEKINTHLASIGLSSYDDEIVEELKVWVQLFQAIICYCNHNNISKDILSKVISIKASTENRIKDYEQSGDFKR